MLSLMGTDGLERRRTRERQPRFDRQAWLEQAMEVLAREGQAKLRIEALSRQLGVSRGSFYHHFKDREDFVSAIVDHWAETITPRTNPEVTNKDRPPEDRLILMMQLIEQNRLDRFDIAFRSWAAQEPAVAEKVREVDRRRYEFVRSLFAEMGFEGGDLEDRVQIFLTFHSAQRTIHIPGNVRVDKDTIARRHAFFTRQLSKKE